MAIFDKSDTESNTTIIASGTKIDGEFNLNCKLHIDGEVSGKINSTNIVSIGSKGFVKGELTSDKLIVSGIFEGVAKCSSIELLKEGKIVGNITTKDLMIESGSFFEGECHLEKNTNQDIDKDSAI